VRQIAGVGGAAAQAAPGGAVRPAPKLGGYRELIDEWLIADQLAPRKQPHRAKRIWRRLVDEHGVEVAETTVRDHVRRRRRELGLTVGEVFVPQAHAPGRTAEVDWGEAEVELAGARTRVHLFFMVLRASATSAISPKSSPLRLATVLSEPVSYLRRSGPLVRLIASHAGPVRRQRLRGGAQFDHDLGDRIQAKQISGASESPSFSRLRPFDGSRTGCAEALPRNASSPCVAG
jgi:hypothetical protein